ncbi:hypothetical protein EJ110_NYTH46497 [Nymphaea thermarum]|nr:hypothetical protein EJ110_NYTH46497 [Nymphaea thermarum]
MGHPSHQSRYLDHRRPLCTFQWVGSPDFSKSESMQSESVRVRLSTSLPCSSISQSSLYVISVSGTIAHRVLEGKPKPRLVERLAVPLDGLPPSGVPAGQKAEGVPHSSQACRREKGSSPSQQLTAWVPLSGDGRGGTRLHPSP